MKRSSSRETRIHINTPPIPALPWEDRPESCTDPLWRYSGNPVITRRNVPESHLISNSAAVAFREKFAGVFRCDAQSGDIFLNAGFSDDGISWKIEPKCIFFAEDGTPMCGYDPRVCRMEDGRYYITWCSRFHGPSVGIAWTDDFRTFHKIGNALLPANRNGVLFPRKINGEYLLLSRPCDWGHTPCGDIFLSRSKDFIYWGKHEFVMPRYSGWQSLKIGAGPVPVETEEGWLLIYHGVFSTCNGFVYSFGAALLDLEQPWKVLFRGDPYLLTPEAPYETTGFVPNVAFPTAMLVDAPSGRMTIYYGCADTCVGICFGYVDEIVEWLKKHSLIIP